MPLCIKWTLRYVSPFPTYLPFPVTSPSKLFTFLKLAKLQHQLLDIIRDVKTYIAWRVEDLRNILQMTLFFFYTSSWQSHNTVIPSGDNPCKGLRKLCCWPNIHTRVNSVTIVQELRVKQRTNIHRVGALGQACTQSDTYSKFMTWVKTWRSFPIGPPIVIVPSWCSVIIVHGTHCGMRRSEGRGEVTEFDLITSVNTNNIISCKKLWTLTKYILIITTIKANPKGRRKKYTFKLYIIIFVSRNWHW